jgi:hypothetical protein
MSLVFLSTFRYKGFRGTVPAIYIHVNVKLLPTSGPAKYDVYYLDTATSVTRVAESGTISSQSVEKGCITDKNMDVFIELLRAVPELTEQNDEEKRITWVENCLSESQRLGILSWDGR